MMRSHCSPTAGRPRCWSTLRVCAGASGCSSRRRPAAWGACSCSWRPRRASGWSPARAASASSRARELGAAVAVDYREPGWTERVREAVGGVDVVFDGVGGETGRAAFGLLERGGKMLSFGLASGEWAGVPEEDAAARGVALVRPGPSPEQLRAFTEQALAAGAAGRLRPVIGQRFPLDRAADAHAAIEARATVGKTLLEI